MKYQNVFSVVCLSGLMACASAAVVPPQDSGVGVDAALGTDATATDAADSGVTQPPTDWGSAKCEAVSSALPLGLKTGDRLGSVVVKDCDGNAVTLDQYCGASALWVFAAHGWCPHCQLVAKNAEAIHSSFGGRNLASVNILVQTASRGVPTAQDCKAWKEAYKMNNVVALYDDTGATEGLWDTNSTALSVFVSRDRTIVSKSHTDVTASLTKSIETSLTR
jgi:hypothetical protein